MVVSENRVKTVVQADAGKRRQPTAVPVQLVRGTNSRQQIEAPLHGAWHVESFAGIVPECPAHEIAASSVLSRSVSS